MPDGLDARLADALGYSGGGEMASDEFFPYLDHIGPRLQTLLLADGSRMGVLRMRGAPFSLALGSTRNSYKRRLVAYLNAVADENVEVHIHLVKHDADLPWDGVRAASRPPPPRHFARVLLADYHASIEDDAASVDWFLTVRVKPRAKPLDSIADKLRAAIGSVGIAAPKSAGVDPALDVQLEDAMRLALGASGRGGTLAPFAPVRLGVREERHPDADPADEPLLFSEIAEFLYLLRTTQFSPQPLTDVTGFLGAGIAGVDVTAVARKRMLRLDHAAGGAPESQTWAAMVGLLTHPRRLDQSRLDALLTLPGRFVMTVAIRFHSRAEAQDKLSLLQRRLIAGGDKAVSDAEALEEAIDDVAGGRAESGTGRWSIAFHGATPTEVDGLVSLGRTVLANAGAKVGPEKRGMLNSYLAQLPGAPLRTWIRKGQYNNKQISVLAALSGYPRGPERARWDHHLFDLISEAGTRYAHDLFVGDVGHGVIIAPNGAGKTVLLGTCIAALDGPVSRKGGTQIVLDVDESNAATILALEGRYSTIRVGKSGLAPLRGLPDTPRVRHMLRNLVAGLVQTDGAPPPTKVERDGIRHGVDFVMGEMEPHERRLRVVRDFMGHEEHGAGERLEPWCEGGELGWVFDGDEHVIDFDHRLVGVDLTEVMGDPRIMQPLAMVLLWMASDVMDGRRVVVWTEEAPAYMPSPAFAKPFKGIALRARKRNASFQAIAQQPGDLLENEAGHALIKQARQIVALRNDKPVEADYLDGMGFTPAEMRAVREGMFAVPFHTVLVKRQDGQSGVYRFDLSALPQHLDVLSGTPKRVKLMRDCLARSGGDVPRALAHYQARIHETAA